MDEFKIDGYIYRFDNEQCGAFTGTVNGQHAARFDGRVPAEAHFVAGHPRPGTYRFDVQYRETTYGQLRVGIPHPDLPGVFLAGDRMPDPDAPAAAQPFEPFYTVDEVMNMYEPGFGTDR